MLGHEPEPRKSRLCAFRDQDGSVIDSGLAIFFQAPASFTGEDVLELQGHGGPVIVDMVLQRVLALGARLAEPGEFSRRAYLNDKLDLAQAEAIADLIDARTRAAARSAVRSLSGVFSQRVNAIAESITRLRLYVEAAIDFPEEEIDFLADGEVARQLETLIADVEDLQARAHNGRLLHDGLHLVIAGLPNAGKSSLLNALTGQDSAIVTELPGTTRDVLRETIAIDGLPVHLVDTAGLRDSADPVEREGVRRAQAELATADHALWVYDGAADPGAVGLTQAILPADVPLTLVHNKADLSGQAVGLHDVDGATEIRLSARTGEGVDLLRQYLKQLVAFDDRADGDFSARGRHLDAIRRTLEALRTGLAALRQHHAGELLAEDLREAHRCLMTVTGEFSPDDLLGEIFGSFCIGK
jgi:tRNA modification GTPase